MNNILADELDRIADNYKTEGEIFRSNAYSRASTSIRKHKNKINSGKQAREEIPGIGNSIERTIEIFLLTGHSDRFQEENDKNIIIELFQTIHGIGHVKANSLYDEGYRNLKQLRKADLNHAQKVGLKYYDDFELKIPRSEMDQYNDLLHELFDPFQLTWEIAGSYRRGKPESGDIDILFREDIMTDGEPLLLSDITDTLGDYLIADLTSKGRTKYMGVIRFEGSPSRRIDIRLISPRSYYYALLYFTGSKELNVKMRNKAISMNMTLNEYSLYRLDASSEEEIFDHLKMKYIPPTER